ncbi:MAG: hypothetical protein IJT34_08595, partial [Butyrivibrio sp.]|nr:hypothetical protein [Butyrivibrio sp.]
MANFDTAPHITDERIRELVEDLSTVTGSNKHGGTTAFDNVLRGILELSNAYMPFYNSNEPLTKAELKKVYDAFDNFYSTCSEYLRGKGDTRASGYGQGRLTCVRNLMNQVGKDLDALVRVYQNTPENGTTPPLAEILHKGRGLSVVVDDPSEIMPVGGAINQRIPIRVQTDIQDQKGFFTPENTMKSRAEAERELEERYAGDPVANKLFRFVSSGDEEEREEQQERFVQLLGGGFGNAMLDIKGAPNLDEDELFEYLWNDKAAMHTLQLSLGIFWQEYKENTAEGINDTITEDEVFGDKETFRSFYNLARDAMRANAGYKGLKAAGIKEGEEVAKRNVLQSRMAMLIGNGNLVANAKTMELQVGDTRQRGIFMETAEGSNVNRVKFAQLNEGDQVSKEIADPMMGATTEDYRNSPLLIMDLADLQVHDYLVGSTDRSISNMIIDMDWSTGKYSRNSGAVKVNGLKGIDNDNCAGDASDEELQKAGPYGCMMPQEMLVIRRSTAE